MEPIDSRQQNPIRIRQVKALKSEGSTIIHGRDKPDETVYHPEPRKLGAPLSALPSKDTKWEWITQHDRAFDEIKKTIQRITELQHFER